MNWILIGGGVVACWAILRMIGAERKQRAAAVAVEQAVRAAAAQVEKRRADVPVLRAA